MLAGWKTILTMAAATVTYAADPALINHIPADAKVVVGINMGGFSTSAAAKSLFGQAQAAQPQLQQMAKAAGVDPLRDVKEVLIASRGDQKSNQALVLMRGAFEPARLTAMAGQAGAAAQDYRGVTVLAGKNPDEGWLAVLDASTVAYGDPASVRGVIDRRGADPGPGPKLRARIAQAAGTYDFWFASTAPLADLASGTDAGQLGGAALQGELLKAVEEISGGVKFGTDLKFGLEAVTRSEKDAAALTDVLRFFSGMAQASAQKDPKTAQSFGFLDKLELSTQGNVVLVRLTVPGAELSKLMQQAVSAALRQASPSKPAAAPAKSKPAPPPPVEGLPFSRPRVTWGRW